MRKIFAIILAVTAIAFLFAATVGRTNSHFSNPPSETRSVKGQVLTSTEMPAVRLKFVKDFKYVGTQKFILYDVANAEQHFFVDADSEGRIRRMYWVQFEGYLPTVPHSYKYTVNKSVNLGGFDFVADAYARNTRTNPSRPGSDGTRAREFLESKGYKFASDDVLMQRLVHLIGDDKRNELMIIYLEDLTRLGFVAADLAKDGRAADRWNEISAGLLDRASKNVTISRQ